MNLWDRRADINGDASRTRDDGDSLIWVFLTGPIILPSDQLPSASDAPQPLRELFLTLQHYCWVTVKETSAITDIQCELHISSNRSQSLANSMYHIDCVHYADDGQAHLEIVNFRTHSPYVVFGGAHSKLYR